MFSLFKKNPTKKLNTAYSQKLEEAMHAQRGGDIQRYSELTAEAEAIYKQILELETKPKIG